jgi:hypothetical protein
LAARVRVERSLIKKLALSLDTWYIDQAIEESESQKSNYVVTLGVLYYPLGGTDLGARRNR